MKKQFISYEKLSKKQKRAHDLEKRGTWGVLRPVTRKVKSKLLYSRKTVSKAEEEP